MMDYASPTTFKYCIGHNVQGEPMYSEDTQPGMTLRDYFAAQALNGLIAQSGGTALSSDVEQGAKYAYMMADAMIAERIKL